MGTRGKTAARVVLACDGVETQMHPADLLKVVNRKIGTTTSTSSEPVTFLTWSQSAPSSSLAGEAMRSLPKDSLALLVAPMDGEPAAVLSGRDLENFSEWVRALPV